MANEIEVYKLDPSKWADAAAAFKTDGKYTDPVSGNVATAPFQPADIAKYADGSDPWGHPNTDWFDATLKTWSPQSRHNIQLTGGSEAVSYTHLRAHETPEHLVCRLL